MSAESTVQASKAERSAPDQDNRYAADPETIRAFHELLDRQSRGASSFTSPILVAKNDQSLESSAPVGAQVSQEPTDGISDDRRRMITKWIRQDASPNVFQRTFGDSEGKRLADALEGNSELGKLSPAEQSFIMQKTIGQWLTHDGDFSSRAIADFAKAIGGQGDLSTRAGATLAAMSADAMSTYFDSSNDLNLGNYAGSLALAAAEVTAGNRASPDAAALRRMIQGMGGQKAALYGDALATAATYSNDAATRLGQVLTAMNQGPETPASAQFAFHAFVSAGEHVYRRTSVTQTGDIFDMGPADAAAPMATALARIMHPDSAQAQAAEAQRLTAIMTSPAGAKLFAPELGSDQASLQLRVEVFNALKAHPEITAENLMSGSSPWMLPSMAQSVAEKSAQTYFATRGDKAIAYEGTDLDNMVGVAMHLKPEEAPKNETPQQQAAREKATAQGQYSYFHQEPAKLVRDAIRDADRDMGGDGSAPNVTVLPIQVSMPDAGPVQLPIFRVDRVVDGKPRSQIVDNRGARFTSFEEWRAKNALPDGVMTFPAQGHLTAGAGGKVQLQSQDTPETHNTWHHVRGYIDKAALVGGVVAGTCVTFGWGMAVAVPVGIGAGLYGAGRATENLADMYFSNQTLNPLKSSEARANYLTAAAGLLGSAGMAAGRFGQAAAKGGVLVRTVVVGTQVAGVTSDAVAMGNQMRDAALHWDQMSPNDKIITGLSFAFWGVTAAAQVRGGLRQMYDFRAQQQRIVNETPTKSGASKPKPIGTSESEPDHNKVVQETKDAPVREETTATAVPEEPSTDGVPLAKPHEENRVRLATPEEVNRLGTPDLDKQPPGVRGWLLQARSRLIRFVYDIHYHPTRYDPNERQVANLRQLLERTADPKGGGPTIVFEQIPQDVPEGQRYYLRVVPEQDASKVQNVVQANVWLTSDHKIIINEDITYRGSDGKPVTIPKGEYPEGDPHIQGRLPPFPREGSVLCTINLIPDFRLSFNGLWHDKNLIDEIMKLPELLRRRVRLGLTSADPASSENVKDLKAALAYLNEKDPNGTVQVILGETTIAKEGVIGNLDPNMQPNLTRPQTIDQLLKFTDETKTAIVVHSDSASSVTLGVGGGKNKETFLVHNVSDSGNVKPLLDIFRRHRDTTIVWAHAGGLGRSIQPGANHIEMMERVLQDPTLNHVTFDLSWDVVAKYFVGDQRAMGRLVALMDKYPDRFVYGSDAVAANSEKGYYSTLDAYFDSGLLRRLKPETAEKFLWGNAQRITNTAGQNLTDYRLAHRQELQEFRGRVPETDPAGNRPQ